MHEVRVRESAERAGVLWLDFFAHGFRRRMVRNLASYLVDVGRGARGEICPAAPKDSAP